MTKKASVSRSSGNVFADIGLPDADEHLLKARVVMFISLLIEARGLTQQAAASRMRIAQPDVSNLLRGRFEGFSLERLLGFARALGSDVEITMKRPARNREGRMSLVVG
jgi:predicted XRE-type DNA-binding protein